MGTVERMENPNIGFISTTFTDFMPVGSRPPPILTLVPEHSPHKLNVEELGSRIVALSGRVASATCRWLLLIAEFDRLDGSEAFGLGSTAHWLSHHCGITARTARDHVKVAHTLAAHDVLAEAMRSGHITYSHVRAIARVAEDDEHELVAHLLNMAMYGTVGQLEAIVRGLQTVEHELTDPVAERTRKLGEQLSTSWESDSRWQLIARLDPENGSLVQSALDAVSSCAPDGERLTGAEALVRLAEIALAAMNDSPTPPRALRGHERATVVIQINAADVPQPADTTTSPAASGSREPLSGIRTDATPGTAGPVTRPYGRIAGGPGLPDHVIEHLACVGRIRVMVRDTTGSVLDLGRSHRVVTEKQFMALLQRDSGCTHPGCGSKWHLEAHHIRHWLHGGRTDMANLVLLCGRHHTGHHKGDFTIAALGGQQFSFIRADGRLLSAHVDPATLFDTDVPIEDEHDHVAADAAGNHWTGERLDRAYGISCISAARYRAKERAEASA